MRTTASTRQGTRADLASAPKVLDWAVYIRQNVKLTASARSLAFLLITLGQGQHISMSVTRMADSIGMKAVTVRAALRELHDKGLIVVKANGRNQTTIYRLTMPVRVDPVEDQLGSTEEDHLGSAIEDHLGSTEGDHLGSTEGDHNIEQEEEEVQEDLHQHADDDVVTGTTSPSGEKRAKATARSTSTRAKDDHPPIEVYISDIEDVVDELEHRLGMAPGTVNIKALAKKWRELVIRQGHAGAGVSHTLQVFSADHPMWSRCATKGHPVGYLLDEIDRWLSE